MAPAIVPAEQSSAEHTTGHIHSPAGAATSVSARQQAASAALRGVRPRRGDDTSAPRQQRAHLRLQSPLAGGTYAGEAHRDSGGLPSPAQDEGPLSDHNVARGLSLQLSKIKGPRACPR